MENCMKTDEVVDYAMPMMKIEKLLRKAHDLCLGHRYAEAREVALHLGVEARILQHTLSIMEGGPTARTGVSS
jgi:hypothetical protein